MMMTWTPLLDGAMADAAMTAARSVARHLAAARSATASPGDRALFWAYAGDVLDEPAAAAAYDAALDDLVAELERRPPSFALYGGLAGTAWTLCHVLDEDSLVPLSTVDEVLVDLVARDAGEWRSAHELVAGLAGIGVYFLERLARGSAPLAREGLERVVALLDATSLATAAGRTWHTSPAWLLPRDAAAWPSGLFDVGIAHGVPGVAAMLDRAARISDPPRRARALCDEAAMWIASQRQPRDPDGRGRFPARVSSSQPVVRARSAWCYGDPGVAAALWAVAPALARDIALESTQCSLDRCGVSDAGLCHGAAGLAHLFNRFYQASRDAAFADAARAWIARALAMRRPGGSAPFFSDRHELGLVANDSLLEGSIGIALVLVAAVAPVEPRWDRLLVCDLPLYSDGDCS